MPLPAHAESVASLFGECAYAPAYVGEPLASVIGAPSASRSAPNAPRPAFSSGTGFVCFLGTC